MKQFWNHCQISWVRKARPLQLEINVGAKPRNEHRAARLVVSGIVDVLQIERRENSAPDVRGIISFEDFFAAITEPAVSENKPESTECKVSCMVTRNAIDREHRSCPVVATMPSGSLEVRTAFGSSIHLGIGERFVMPVAPTQARKNAELRSEILLEIQSKAVLMPPLPAGCDNARPSGGLRLREIRQWPRDSFPYSRG